ncbi:MAG: efflux transporter outer membrane subunit [Acidobacteria bacterium]|nr:efflux transporter outer membrane subunit [Acidobacteriota bacterium]
MTGCAVGPRYSRPVALAAPADRGQPPAAYKESQGWKQAQPAATSLHEDWWRVFGIAELDDLEAQVDVSNQTVKAAEARFRQARTLVAQSRSALYPTLGAGPSITTNRFSGRTATHPTQIGEYSNLAAPFDFTYELDAWGRIRHTIAAAREEVQAASADLDTIRLSLHAEMAIDYFELRSLDAQRQLLDRTLVAYQKALDLTQSQFAGGLASGAEVAQARTQLETTRAQYVEIGVARAQFEHAIATLAGRTPESLALALQPLAGPPPVIPTGMPSQLLERRPDVAAAERRVAEANERIGIAQAAFFPSLFITATGGVQGDSIVNWITWPSRFWALGPAALQTIYDAGRRRAAEQGAIAAYDLTVANYREAAIEAFQQVEDQLSTLRTLEQEVDAQRAAVAAAERSLDLAMQRYTGGLVTYLEVVSAQTIALTNERIAVDLLRRRMDATVLLIKALGGGWDISKLPA